MRDVALPSQEHVPGYLEFQRFNKRCINKALRSLVNASGYREKTERSGLRHEAIIDGAPAETPQLAIKG